MHIPDNYLSPTTCLTLLTTMAPIWAISIKKVHAQIKEKKQTVPLIGTGAAFAFLLMMFNVPIPGGTTAHAVGGALLAILLGPWAACLAISVALLLQAFIFGDGGILAYGANVFNMGFIMPFVGYLLFSIGKRLGHPRAGSFVAGYVSINIAALAAGIELGLQPLLFHTANHQPLYCPYPLSISVPAMVGAHALVIGWIEAFVTLLVYQFVSRHAPEDLYSLPTTSRLERVTFPVLGILALLSPLGLLASGSAWGEWNNQEIMAHLRSDHMLAKVPAGMSHGIKYHAVFANYGVTGLSPVMGYLLSAGTCLIVIALAVRLIGARRHE
ncbi:cobalt transporter CbiM [Furfurilactobacillus sp. WILCCON 0119]